MSKSWKQALLASGLPLEYEIKRYLEAKGCIADFEYSYLRPNETNIDRQFSYDIDAAYIKESHFVTLMVECKYRHPSTQWVFTPDSYGAAHELDANAFMHPMDHFVSRKFPFSGTFPRELGPPCSKGIELTSSGDNDKSIAQALMQLAYAFAPKITGAIESQVFSQALGNDIFYHVPIIATTANLYRLTDNATIEDLKTANTLEEVATQEKCLVLKYSIGIELRRYNERIMAVMRERLGDAAMRDRLDTFTKDLDFLFSVMSEHYSPEAVVIIHADKTSLDHLFSYIDELLTPSETLLSEIKKQRDEASRRLRAWKRKLKSRTSGKAIAKTKRPNQG